MYEKLIELINEARDKYPNIPLINGCKQDFASYLADHLLENGVVVPTCKVGDKVYSITESSCENIDGMYTECKHYGYGEDDRICNLSSGAECPYQYRVAECYATELNILMIARELGKTVFLSRDDAERALRKEGGAE